MSKRIAVLLSGCGVYDGSEIHEATFILLALDQAGAKYQCCAPDKSQADVVNHLTGDALSENRNVLQEAARIARGNIVSASEIKAADYDGIILPGGFGAAKNLCDYATAGENAKADPQVQSLLQEFQAAGKPIAAVCIAPVVLATALCGDGKTATLTIGNDAGTASHLEGFGARHQECPVSEFVVDRENKIITSPAYMYGEARPSEVYEGVRKTVNALLEMA